jgi:hypothetical protein
MNSANGTYVNGKRVGEHYLNDGDEILIGKHALKYQAHGAVATQASPAPPADDQLQDALHTYVMDGSKIRERLAGMHGGADPATEAPKVPGTSRLAAVGEGDGKAKTAADHALDFDPLKPQRRPTVPIHRPVPQQGGGGMKVFLYLSLAMNAILIVLMILLIAFLFKLAPQGLFGGVPQPQQPSSAQPPASGGATP